MKQRDRITSSNVPTGKPGRWKRAAHRLAAENERLGRYRTRAVNAPPLLGVLLLMALSGLCGYFVAVTMHTWP